MKLLTASAITKEDYAKNPQAVLDVLEFYTENQKREREEYGEHGLLGPIPGFPNIADDKWADLLPKNSGPNKNQLFPSPYDPNSYPQPNSGMNERPIDKPASNAGPPMNRYEAAESSRKMYEAVSLFFTIVHHFDRFCVYWDVLSPSG